MSGVFSLWKGRLSRPVKMAEIAEVVAFLHDVTVDDLRGPSRVRPLVHARQHFMADAYETKQWSMPQIGRYLGWRDHTTVLHGVRAHAKRVAIA